MSQHLRRTALVACGTAALLGLTACSSGAAHTSAAPASAAASSAASSAASPASSPSPTGGTAGLPNGNKLNALLLPASALPQNLKLDPSGTQSTGDGFNPPIAPSPVAPPKACDMLRQTNWTDSAGANYASFAQNDYTDDAQDMFAQDVSSYRGNDAITMMATLKQNLTACHTFPTTVNGQTYTETVTLKPLTGLGDEAVEAVITSPNLDGGTTLVAARVGGIVVSTLDNDQRNTGTAGVALTETLVKNVAAAH
ncbi:hypothetical protein LN042_30525 [Kitasatospora sp. RB6PN24]|uniref:hypothetical protein n=1 Tax=Kitasatospora humi TaxID=2893891 RepID=UPI001E4119FA|nr:hypothetical protein [Kitasatospora humi]MCC9311347.1 hypothetical protein [Kitasatospora humi]